MAFEIAAIIESGSESIICGQVEETIFWKLPPTSHPWLHIDLSATLIILEVETTHFLL